MTKTEMESRLIAIEQEVKELRAHLQAQNGSPLPPANQEAVDPAKQRPWWREDAGRFANDPVFDEMVRLGKEYRESLHPDRKKRSVKKTKRTNDHS